jgi:hypothetical protein
MRNRRQKKKLITNLIKEYQAHWEEHPLSHSAAVALKCAKEELEWLKESKDAKFSWESTNVY